MKKHVGTSEPVTTADTSVKAVRGGGGSGGKVTKGTKFRSDFVYEGKPEIDQITNYNTQLGTDPKLEFEYDKNGQYLVYTTTGGNEIKRTAYIGSFDITSDGIIKRATVNEERIGTGYPGKPSSSPDSQNISAICRYPQPYSLNNVDGLVRFWAAGVTAKQQIQQGEPIPSTAADSINQKFFPDGWWNAPFTSNLL